MKYIGIEYKKINLFPIYCMIYYGEQKAYLKQFPKHNIDRCHTNHMKRLYPKSFFVMLPSLYIFSDFLGAIT